MFVTKQDTILRWVAKDVTYQELTDDGQPSELIGFSMRSVREAMFKRMSLSATLLVLTVFATSDLKAQSTYYSWQLNDVQYDLTGDHEFYYQIYEKIGSAAEQPFGPRTRYTPQGSIYDMQHGWVYMWTLNSTPGPKTISTQNSSARYRARIVDLDEDSNIEVVVGYIEATAYTPPGGGD